MWCNEDWNVIKKYFMWCLIKFSFFQLVTVFAEKKNEILLTLITPPKFDTFDTDPWCNGCHMLLFIAFLDRSHFSDTSRWIKYTIKQRNDCVLTVIAKQLMNSLWPSAISCSGPQIGAISCPFVARYLSILNLLICTKRLECCQADDPQISDEFCICAGGVPLVGEDSPINDKTPMLASLFCTF